MIFEAYHQSYLPGTDLYVDTIPAVEGNIPYHAGGHCKGERLFFHEHVPKNTVQDVGLVKLSAQLNPEKNLYVFAEKYHPVFLAGIEDELRNGAVTPYSFELKQNTFFFERIPQGRSKADSISESISSAVKSVLNQNPGLETILSVLEKEFK